MTMNVGGSQAGCGAAALAGLSVVEVDTGVQAQFAGKHLLGMGADVVLVEPPTGNRVRRLPPMAADLDDGTRSVPFEALNAGKRSVVLDTATDRGRGRLREIAREADILLVGGAEWIHLYKRLPAPTVVVHSLYGMRGSATRAVSPSTPFTRYHAGGDGSFLPTSMDTGLRPTTPGRLIGDGFAGTGIVTAALHGHLRFQETGERQVVDFCQQAYFVTLNKMFVSQSSYYDVRLNRLTHTYPFGGNVPCRDGYVAILILEESQWRGLCAMVGELQWLEDPRFRDGVARRANGEEVDLVLKRWCMERTTREVIEAGRACDVPIGLVSTAGDLRQMPALKKRGFLTTASTAFGPAPVPGLPFGPDFPAAEPGARAPEPGGGAEPLRPAGESGRPRAEEPVRPLSDLRILDLTWAGAGPIITWTLATLGADVAKIEHPSRPDLLRRANRTYGWAEDDNLDGSPAFNEMNAGKRSVVVDLGTERGRELAFDLARHADIFCESMRPGKLESLGLGYEAVRTVNPSVVYCSLSATGRNTGEAGMPGYAPIFWAEGGGAWLSGWPQADPDYVRSPVDMHAGIFACAGILAAIERRRRTGEGTHIDLSAIETVTSTLPDALFGTVFGVDDGLRAGNERPPWRFNDVLPCVGEDRWIAISIADDEQWRALGEELGIALEPLGDENGDGERHLAQLIEATRGRVDEELEAALQHRGVAASRVSNLVELIHDEDLTARGYWQDVPHAVLGEQRISGLPWLLESAAEVALTSAPLLDADTDSVLSTWLGLNEEQIDELRAGGYAGGTQASLAGGSRG